VIVRVAGAEHAEAYDRFIHSHPHSLFYHSWRYREFLQALIGCQDEYLVAIDRGNIHAALPLMRTADGRIYNSLPFFGTSAGIIAADTLGYRALAAAYNDIACRPSTTAATIVGSQFGPRLDAELLSHNLVDHRIAQLTPLPADGDRHDQLMAAFDASARRNVRKAQSSGVSIDIDAGEMPQLTQMHRAGMDAIGGTPKTDKFFALVPRFFCPHEDYDLYVARYEGAVIAALLLFYFGRTVEYFVPAVDPGHRPLQGLAYLIATAMADASARGFTWWNWGGTWTTQTGVYRFKKKWGAVERSYSYYTQLNDETLRTWPRERLLATWPSFFVFPFHALRDSAEPS
jgi:GNAT acetyltransferase-like protein